jgi:hypothetical protein
VTTEAFRCSTASASRDEALAGTASTVRAWLLLEHPGPWGRDAFTDARFGIDGLGAEIQMRCRRAGVRPLLVRRVDRDAVDERPLAFAASSAREPWIEGTPLASLEEALTLDIEALGRGERLGLDAVEGPLFLVCTHGRHDPCCAERGRPLAFALAEAFPLRTWEASHLGGDRFAGNVVALPQGFYLGRVEPHEAAHVATRFVEGRLSLHHVRGRSTEPMSVQFAELALRRDLALDGIEDVTPETISTTGDVTTARFGTTSGRYDVAVEIARAAPQRLTCHSDHEDAAPTYRVRAITPLA